MDSTPRNLLAAALGGLALACGSGSSDPPPDGGTKFPAIVAHATSPGLDDGRVVPKNGVFELSLTQSEDYGPAGNLFDVDVPVKFTHVVSGTQAVVHGFYYAELPGGVNLWKARFAPFLEGEWSYEFEFTHTPSARSHTGEGVLDCRASELPGFLRVSDENPFQFEDGEGAPVYLLGLNECLMLEERMPLDGGDRHGAFRGDGAIDQYLAAYAQAGFNAFRFSQANCSPDLVDPQFEQYDHAVGMYFDWLCERLRTHGYHVYFNLFGFLLKDFPEDPPPPELVRFVQYCVDRWGAYAGVWELLNERDASDAWIEALAAVVRARDPYGHPVTTSWERPELDGIDLNAPHWYKNESELVSDKLTAQKADEWRAFGKPIVVGEQGNSQPQDQDFGNWSPDSALRMRLRTWTAYFHQVSFLFWNSSWATNCGAGYASNIYIGPDERRVSHLVQWFAKLTLRPDSSVPDVLPVDGYETGRIRAHALVAADTVALYFHHFSDHVFPISGEVVTIQAPAAGTGWFLDPATGALLDAITVAAGPNVVTLPDFVIDLAFFTTPVLGDTDPIAIVDIQNPEADGDLDEDGLPDWGPPEPPFGTPPLTLTLDASASYDLDGGPVSYAWDFGDGGTSTDDVAVHTYTEGDHLTTLTVTDDEGRTARHSFFVRAVADVEPDQNEPPVLSPFADRTITEGEVVIVSPIASDPELVDGEYESGGHSSGAGLTFFVDGLPPGAVFGPGQASAETPRLWWLPAFDQAGTWTLKFRAEDEGGASSAERELTIEVRDSPGETFD